MNRFDTHALLAGVLALALTAGAGATPEHAREVRRDCMHCHTRPKGGSRFLNPTGRYYQEYRRLPAVPTPDAPPPEAGVAPSGAWHPGRDPARKGLGNYRKQKETERQLKARMARWTRSLGAKNCYYCHADRLKGATVEQIKESRVHYEVSVRHQEMVDWINATLGGERVSCYTCHLGGRGPVTMP